jgi:Kef-type K+ transport system membrane component KefB/nucleotide-binding universal stress UspA family protein
MTTLLEHLKGEPIVAFAVLVAVILIVPLLFERLNLPGLVGLLAAGILFGPHGLGLLYTEDPVIQLLSDVGLLYLMFVAGLEIDMAEFQKMKYRAAGFGSLTFALPLLAGTGLGLAVGFPLVSAVLLGSLIASHSLLTYPILSQYEVTRNPAVITTLGATIFTDIAALVVLAICISAGSGDFTVASLGQLILGLIIYALVILFGFDRLGREFFRRSGDNQGNQFLFILLVIFVAAIGAEIIGVEKIVGAFLAGLAVNEVVGNTLVKEKVVFVGNVLFIPIFFVDIGLLIDVPAFFSSARALGLSLSILAALLISKFLAAFLAQRLYRFHRMEMLTMWGMSIPQVATTLAAALVGHQAGLLSDAVLNGVVVMLLVTAILGPLIVRQTARSLPLPPSEEPAETPLPDWNSTQSSTFTALVPVYNPKTEQYLIEMAALLAEGWGGVIKPLAIANAQDQLDSARMNRIFKQREILLAKATEVATQLQVPVEPLLRIDKNVAEGISRTAREQKANLIVMGWSERDTLTARLFGTLIDNVLWSAHCSVAITRLHISPKQMTRILVPIKQVTAAEAYKVQVAMALAKHNHASVTLLHVTKLRTSPNRIEWIKGRMQDLAAVNDADITLCPKVVAANDAASAIVQESHFCDLVIMRTHRRRSGSMGELKISRLSNQVIRRLEGSVILLGEPRSNWHGA